jgi:Pyridoxal-dependent decarboxylase, C-terminal sheet domain
VRPRLWAEPGCALVAGALSVVVVLLHNGNALYVTDGVYGSLSDAGAPGFRFPARLLRPSAAATHDYMLFGPTCDSAERMAGPFPLPADVAAGDWIEIGQLGAPTGPACGPVSMASTRFALPTTVTSHPTRARRRCPLGHVGRIGDPPISLRIRGRHLSRPSPAPAARCARPVLASQGAYTRCMKYTAMVGDEPAHTP